MRFAVFVWAIVLGGIGASVADAQMMRRQTQVLDPWDRGPSSGSATTSMTTMTSMTSMRRPHRDRHLGSTTHFPHAIISSTDVLDPFVEKRMNRRERQLTRAARRSRARLARCSEQRRIERYQIELSPLRVRGGPNAPCVQRALTRARLPGSGAYELALNYRNERPVGVYVIDRQSRSSSRQAPSPTPAQPRLACRVPQMQGAARRTGDDAHFPDFMGMRIEAVERHRTGPIAEAACRGIHTEVLNPWSTRSSRTGAPSDFERSWARRVRQRSVLVLACIPSEERPPSWALTFQVVPDGTVTPLYEATQAMASCIQSRISPPPQTYKLRVNFGESPEQLYVDTR